MVHHNGLAQASHYRSRTDNPWPGTWHGTFGAGHRWNSVGCSFHRSNMGLCFRAGIPKGPPCYIKKPPGSAEDGASWSQVCGFLPACRAVPYARNPRGESGLIRRWSPPGLPAGRAGIKRAGISAGGWGLIAATREAVAASHTAQVPCCGRVMTQKYKPKAAGRLSLRLLMVLLYLFFIAFLYHFDSDAVSAVLLYKFLPQSSIVLPIPSA